ncbi:hypothetical protein N9850_04155 [Granulosicoccus sp.]|nr:hypothetical protein [Granulosicoccus sp.]MDB4222942.1 hypothetical protein [Granulosicoccus sp.]
MTRLFNNRCYMKLLLAFLFAFSFSGSLFAATWSVDSKSEATAAAIAPGSSVTIKATEEFDEWFFEQSQKNNKVLVYTNGQLLGDIVLRLRNADAQQYVFEFDRLAINSSIWPAIRSRTANSPYFTRNVDLAFGDATSIHWSQGIQSVQLNLVSTKVLATWLSVIACLLIIFLVLARKSDILRAGEPLMAGARPPMSLACTQMAFWLFIIVSSYVFIWLVSGNLNSTNETVLILLGIASGTYLGSVFIESTSEVVQVKQNQSPQTDQSYSTLKKHPVRKRETKWFMQLLSDNTGVKLHRFQILTWTVVLGGIFVAETVKSLSMPTFPPSLLGLLGISTTTYLGFKFPELKGQDQTPA